MGSSISVLFASDVSSTRFSMSKEASDHHLFGWMDPVARFSQRFRAGWLARYIMLYIYIYIYIYMHIYIYISYIKHNIYNTLSMVEYTYIYIYMYFYINVYTYNLQEKQKTSQATQARTSSLRSESLLSLSSRAHGN